MTDVGKISKIKFEYIQPAGFQPLYANGVLGGPNSKGDIVMNFYLEVNTLPNVQVFNLDGGKLGSEIAEKRQPAPIKGDSFTVIRHMQTSVMLSLNEAKAMHKWLGDQIATVESNTLKNGPI